MDFNFKMKTKNIIYRTKLEWTISNIWNLPPQLESDPFSPIPGSSAWVILLDFQEANQWKMLIKCFEPTRMSTMVKLEGTLFLKDPTNSINLAKRSFNANVKFNEINDVSNFSPGLSHLYFSRDLGFTGNELIFEFHFKVTTSFNTSCENNGLKDTSPSEEIETVLEKIYKRNVYTDVAFDFDERSIRCHKAVLTVASPVFEKMFEHDTLENKTNSVSIEDIDIDVFECFLEFLYSRKINENIKNNLDSMLVLYEVSDKYEVCNLQKICANTLLSHFLSVDNVCKILTVADLHGDVAMKNSLFKFLKERFSEVVGTREWSSITTKNIKLAAEVVAFVTSQIPRFK